MSFILIPGVAPKSIIDAVGRPPTQKKASIFLSFKAPADSETPNLSRHVLIWIQSISLDDP